MKADTHPTCQDVKVTCSCGNTFTTEMVLDKKELSVEICGKCHPFYTGEMRLVDTQGRIDSFDKKFSGFSRRKAKKADDQA